MKIKSIIIALGLIITMISGVKSNYFNNTTNEAENFNTVSNQEVISENLISENQEVSVEQEQSDNNADQIEEIKEVKQEPVIQEVPKETQKTTDSQNDKTTKKTETIEKPITQETTPKQEQFNTSVVEKPKEEEQPTPPVTKTLTPDDLEYWCVAGGENHVAGDGENEHGYYSTWDEANQAFESYTKGWASVQYEIEICACGKYYFWAIE